MKNKLFIAIVGTMALVFGGSLTGYCDQATDVSPSLVYGAYVDNFIAKCEAKADLLDSGSVNVRKTAMRATVKGAYMESHRTHMVKYLMEKNAPLNPARIEYHLNQKFAQSVAPKEVYALLLKEHAAR